MGQFNKIIIWNYKGDLITASLIFDMGDFGVMLRKSQKIYRVATVSMLSALSTILFVIGGVPIFIMFPYLKIDLSDVPALIGALIISPGAGLIIELIKSMIHLLRTHTLGLGELMSLFIGSAIVTSFSFSDKFLRKKMSKKKSEWISLGICLVFTVIVALALNSLIYPIFLKVALSNKAVQNTVISYLWAVLVVNVFKVLVTVFVSMTILKFLKVGNFGEDRF